MRLSVMLQAIVLFGLFTQPSHGKDIDLAEVDARVEGDCVNDVFAMKNLRRTLPSNSSTLNSREKLLIKKAESRAKEIYQGSSVDYLGKDYPLTVKSRFIRENKNADFYSPGVIVTATQGGDEDTVTFYFRGWNRKDSDPYVPLLLMAYHDEQSPSAFWVCELNPLVSH